MEVDISNKKLKGSKLNKNTEQTHKLLENSKESSLVGK